MVASDNLSPHQFHPAIEHGQQLPMFMTPHEIGGMMSADFGGPMRDVPEQMRSKYTHAKAQVELRGHTPGSSTLDRTEQQVREHGGIHTPVMAVHLPSGVASLYDGHHRSVVAMENNYLVPVEHHFSHHSAMNAMAANEEAESREAARRKAK